MNFLRLPTSGLKRKKRQYDGSLIAKAYNDVMHGASVYKAAYTYGIPESTLRDRTLGLQPVDDLPIAGPATNLTHEEEQQLIDHTKLMCNIGYGYGRREFLTLATDFAISRKRKTADDAPFSQTWFEGLKRRWPALTLSKPQKLSLVRAKCTSAPVLSKYYTELESVLKDNDLLNKPQCIFNIDETSITMEHTPVKVVCGKGNTPQSITSSRGKNITIIACGNAAGTRLPPFYVFPGKRWNSELMTDTSPGAAGCMSDSGWSNSEVFLKFLDSHFKLHVPLTDTNLIVFDGHKSHVNLILTEWGKKNNVVFFVLPPHTSHLTQPLDVGCFAPLKSAYNRECQTFMRQHPGKQITRYDVGAISSKAYNKAITADNLTASFRKAGIHPFNDSLEQINLSPSTIYMETAPPSDLNINAESFLAAREIICAEPTTKKRATPPTVIGDLSTTHNQAAMQSVAKKMTLSLPPSQIAGTSGIPHRPIPSRFAEDTASDVSDEDQQDDTDLCCVCHKHNADGINTSYTIERICWAQCDSCQHWTHLKYCSRIRCLRRNSVFLCPHCDASTAL